MIKYMTFLLILLIVVLAFFHIPYSQLRAEFDKAIKKIIIDTPRNTNVFTKEDIQDLPVPVQKYFYYCGYLGTPKMSYMKATFLNTDFMLDEDKKVKIDYTQYNFVEKPVRFAYINSAIYGVPFEGLDSYFGGVGSMKGSLAKIITLFDQRGENMDQACLVTFLAESLLIPSVVLQDYITWEELDENHARATISYDGISASGIFTFEDNGAMKSFRTKDRVATGMDGSIREAEWSAVIGDYREENGIKKPQILQAIWHFPEGDWIYFNGNKTEVKIQFH